MELKQIFTNLWAEYTLRTPSAKKIKELFEKKGEEIVNDHVAFRTFDVAEINIDALSQLFLQNGYKESGTYHFPQKKLYAKHFEHKTDENAPLVFISQLITSSFSKKLQENIKKIVEEVDFTAIDKKSLVFKGRLWGIPSYVVYQNLLKESEYAAWLYVNGFCANHFTINVNRLKNFSSLEEVNYFLKKNGFSMNTSDGEIKGSPELFLEQSSTIADKIDVAFVEGTYKITSCYYEFAYRYKNKGQLFRGFVANSADKIFESTDMRQK